MKKGLKEFRNRFISFARSLQFNFLQIAILKEGLKIGSQEGPEVLKIREKLIDIISNSSIEEVLEQMKYLLIDSAEVDKRRKSERVYLKLSKNIDSMIRRIRRYNKIKEFEYV